MFYSVNLTIPPNTPATAPITLDVPLVPGTVHQVDIQFPTGCAGLAHTVAVRGAHQVWPSNAEGNFHADGYVISWQDEYDLDAAPFLLRLFGWNLDDTYAHTVTWRFALRAVAQLPVSPALLAALATLEVDT